MLLDHPRAPRTSDLGVECPLGSLYRISSLPLAEKGSPVSYYKTRGSRMPGIQATISVSVPEKYSLGIWFS